MESISIMIRKNVNCFVLRFAPSLQLLSSLKRFPHPLKSHSSPWRPHCMTVPELLEREDRGREEGVVADRLGRWTPDRDGVLVEDEVEEV